MPQPRETWSLDTAHLGREVLVFDELESTNTTATELSQGFAVVADFQTAGRGQFGRVWQARPGSSLLLSVVLKPPPELRRPVILTALAAVSVAEAVFSLTGVQARIKWPNDLLIRGKKVCGILIESAATTIMGIGLNLTQTAEEFAEVELAATSLAIMGYEQVSVRIAATTVLTHLDAEYARLLAGERVAVEADWKWRVGLLGRQVAVERTDGTTTSGRLLEMGFDALEVDTVAGLQVIVPETVRQLRPM